VVLTPQHVLLFRAGGAVAGAAAKAAVPLAQARCELVAEGEIEAWRPATFSLIPAGSAAETVLSAASESEMQRWVEGITRAAQQAATSAAAPRADGPRVSMPRPPEAARASQAGRRE
jgi:hypothetical protein